MPQPTLDNLSAWFAHPWVGGTAILAAGAATLGYSVLYCNSQIFAPVTSRIPTAGSVALTFDDGPSPQFTPAILDILDRFSAKATFFLIGVNVRAEEQLAREIVVRGHAVGNHTLNHHHTGILHGVGYWQQQLARTQDIILAATGKLPALFRSPMGLKTPAQARAVRALGLHYIAWQQRGFDTLSIPPATIAKYINRRIRPGNIITLHDGLEPARIHLSQRQTIAALPLILSHLAALNLRSLPLHDALPFSTYQNNVSDQ